MAQVVIGSNRKLMIRDVAEAASLGIRFRPTDEELIVDYLALVAAAKETDDQKLLRSNTIINFDVYSCPPWCLPRQVFEYSAFQNDMYFISERRPKTEGGFKVDRNVAGGQDGFWYYNSKRIAIRSSTGDGEVIGIKCSLNYMMFKEAAAADDDDCNNNDNKKKRKKRRKEKEKEKTSWIMHEYTLHYSSHQDSTKFQDVVLCHIYDSAQEQPKRRTIIIDSDDEEEEEAVPAQVVPDQNSTTPMVLAAASLHSSVDDLQRGEEEVDLVAGTQHVRVVDDDSLLDLVDMIDWEANEEVDSFFAEDPTVPPE